MKKAEIKNLLFEKFEARVAAIRKKRDEFQVELNKAVNDLSAEYGELGVVALDDMALTVGAKTKRRKKATPVEKVEETPVAPERQKVPRKRKSRKSNGRQRRQRKHRPRKPGEPSLSESMRKHLPKILAAVGENGKEFTSLDVYKVMKKRGFPDKRVKFNHVSLHLSKNFKELGLKIKSRKVQRGKNKSGKPLPPVNTNFFTLAHRRKSR